MDGEAWWAAVHGVTKSQTRLSDFTSFFPSSVTSDQEIASTGAEGHPHLFFPALVVSGSTKALSGPIPAAFLQ